MKKTSNEEHRDTFDAVASEYDSILNNYALSRRKEILISWTRGDCLEVGAGTGELSKSLAEDHRVVATDISPQMVKEIRKKLDIESHVCDAEKLPFEDASFNTVIAAECIYYLDSPEKFIKEAYRVLKPGGRLLVSSTTGYGIFLERLRTALRFLGFSKMYFNDTNRNYMTVDRIEKLLTPVNFSIQNIHHVILLPFESFDTLNKLFEKISRNTFGLFILVLAEKA